MNRQIGKGDDVSGIKAIGNLYKFRTASFAATVRKAKNEKEMLISLLLAAAIILLMFAGCGNTSNEIASTPAESESVVESQAEVVPEALQEPDVSEEAAETNTPESSEAEDVLDEQEPAAANFGNEGEHYTMGKWHSCIYRCDSE